MDVVRMQPSQEEPILDPEGLWCAGGEGVMIATEVGMEQMLELMMYVWMLPSQEEPGVDQEGLRYAGGKGVMIVETVR